MSSTSNLVPSISTSNFTRIFQEACDEYQKLTGHNLYTHPFSAEIQSCHSPDAILDVLRKQAQTLIKYRKGHEKLLKCLNPIVNILFMFSGTLGEGVGLVSLSSLLHRCASTSLPQPCSPGKTIFAGIGVLLGVGLSHCFPAWVRLRVVLGDEGCYRML